MSIPEKQNYTLVTRSAFFRALDTPGKIPGVNFFVAAARGAVSFTGLLGLGVVGFPSAALADAGYIDGEKFIGNLQLMMQRCSDEFNRAIVEVIPCSTLVLDRRRQTAEEQSKIIYGSIAYGQHVYSQDGYYVLYSTNKFEGNIAHRTQENTWAVMWSQGLSCNFPDHQKQIEEELIRIDALVQNTLFKSKNNPFYHMIAEYV